MVLRLFIANLPLCVNNSHVTPMTAIVINKNAVINLPVKIFLDVICSVNITDYLWVFHIFS